MKIHSDSIVTALILEKGEPVHESLKKLAKDLELPGAFVTGIGALEGVSVGYFQMESKDYKEIKVDGLVELLALNGSISWKEDEPFVHLHAILGLEDGSVMGGHLLRAKVGVTGEIFVHKTGNRLERAKVKEFGLSLIR
jgi:predicted DNA-binding protein with PD1-like motif